jgi:hypothetical protein
LTAPTDYLGTSQYPEIAVGCPFNNFIKWGMSHKGNCMGYPLAKCKGHPVIILVVGTSQRVMLGTFHSGKVAWDIPNLSRGHPSPAGSRHPLTEQWDVPIVPTSFIENYITHTKFCTVLLGFINELSL